MFSILGAIVAIGLLIVVHEAGHYFVARRCGMRVERFSIGFGPPILTWRRGDTDFTVGPIPFGGFVQIRGMTVAEDVDGDDAGAYPNRPAWQRFATIFAGPATNYLFAIVIGFVLFVSAGIPSGTTWYGVAGVEEGWPATGVLQPGDKIVELDGKPYFASRPGEKYPPIGELLTQRAGAPIALTVRRGDADVDVQLTARREQFAGSLFEGVPSALKPPLYRLGIVLTYHDERTPTGVLDAARAAIAYPIAQTRLIAVGLWEIATRQQDPVFMGPVGITTMIKRTIDIGLIQVLELLMMLNVYLGLFNLLPLPALDGGRLVFLGYEMATRRRANPKIEAAVHMVGIMALLVHMVLVTYKDIARFFG
jgi:regulator of sigma E protease